MSSVAVSTLLSPMPTASEKDMRNSGVIARKLGVMSPHVFGERIAGFLRREHPVKTALTVEAATGIPAKTVAKWLEGASSPSGAAYHRLIKVWPELPVFVSPDATPGALRAAARIARQERLERRAAAIRDQITTLREDRA